MTKERLVVIGNGMAGIRTVEELLLRAPGRYDITVFGAEPHPNYNRIMLSPVLAGEKSFEQIILNGRDWYEANGITLHTGDRIEGIDRTAKTVTSVGGKTVAYDKLLLAIGSDPVVLPIPGKELPGVIGFRDLSDVEAMVAAAKTGTHAVVIGGGLLGLEAANGLALNGMEVTVLHLMGTIMERQLDEAAGWLLQAELEGRGIKIITKAQTEAILGDGKVQKVRLADGRELDADLVVMAVGIRPNTALGKLAGLEVNRGIVVDDRMVTSDPDILSVGECVEHRGQTYGLVAPLWDMAKVCADHLAGAPESAYTGTVSATRLKVTGVELYSAGTFGDAGTEDIVFRDGARGVYKRIVLRDNRIVGTVLYGDTKDGPWYFQLLKDAEDIAPLRDTLIFGQGAGAQAQDPFAAVAALPDTAEICGCNGVNKGTVVAAIRDKGCCSVEDVRTHTKASASCGGCTGLVEKLLACTLGDGYQAQTGPKPMCKCTHLAHDDVRRLIVIDKLKSIPAVMQALEWTTAEGCASCRPALNYYLMCAWPGEYKDDNQSRFINERVHANIQKDGTYSVVPRMWGGLTNASELRAIADVVERFQIPTVKVTGGQRIDLLGVKKEDLPAVWSDLNKAGMVSGHAYAKGLRTVKTCVGSEWCRFGTQASMSMGVKLEKMTWGTWTPHKFKMAVSGCPRNCAEATIKDFGVVAVDSGWELHVGGNGGLHVRATDLLMKVETEDEVLEVCGAFLQLYREEARYLERTAPWIERVGIDYVRARMEDVEVREALHQRFLYSQKFEQIDPWAERASGAVDNHEFAPLASLVPLAAE
ncbi:nitrite reductase large subunit NirB [Azospirillum sp. TSO22-1]|uniref:nitrite reductase large subunit NirB n=1 Tax=Azospirillum sp. TSO22-1 TaxID=716789 RepID=UPI000D6111AD|nr:nitrite reductase large subunit NirB [Azospirillum sp. TSO22-1]PWC52383.1 nitrite reductase [Azospirillum sp. TSO22-1]